MASKYSQEYFFQYTLMNVLFDNLNQIIHPNAENFAEVIRHYGSAIFVSGVFCNYSSKIFYL